MGSKPPSSEELGHDYLWRNIRALPEMGRIGIFNRSYDEEVLVTRVHPELREKQNLPPNINTKGLREQRFGEINKFEDDLVDTGIVVLKFFLNVSKDEQKKRFIERLTLAEKNRKFSAADIREQDYWDAYLDAHEDLFNHTSTPLGPLYGIPADRIWGTHLTVAAIIYDMLADLKIDYPTVSEEAMEQLRIAKRKLE